MSIQSLLKRRCMPVLAGLCLMALSCSSAIEPATLATEKRHYDRLKLGERPAIWEDGLRTGLEPGQYEWWYTDAHLDDGSVMVIVFFTRPYVDIDAKAVPQVDIRFTTPDGKETKSTVKVTPEEFSGSRDRCDITIGRSWIRGDLKTYRIHVESEAISADLTLKGLVPAWRPATGHIYFGTEEKDYFAWLPSVPYGRITGDITFNGARRTVSGSGYHDHNWGNRSLAELLNNWWWSRAQFGDYTIITAEMIAEKKYGRIRLPIFLLARNNEILMEDGSKMTFLRSGAEVHPISGKPVEKKITFVYSDPARGVSANYMLERKKDLLNSDLLTMLPSWKARLARLLGARPWYQRFQGDALLNVNVQGKKESLKAETVYELMYLGKPTK